MDNHFRFAFHRRARWAFNSLTEKEQDAVSSSVEKLVDLPVERWASAGAKQFAWDEPLFLLRVNRNWRAIVRANPDGPPELLDIVHRESLRTFAQKT